MTKTNMCDLLGIKHPIVLDGMGPLCNNKLYIAAANAIGPINRMPTVL